MRYLSSKIIIDIVNDDKLSRPSSFESIRCKLQSLTLASEGHFLDFTNTLIQDCGSDSFPSLVREGVGMS